MKSKLSKSRRTVLCAALIFTLSIAASAFARTGPTNPHFEQGVADPPRALTGEGLENLIAFTRLLGYVRHFHPSDEASTADWARLAIEGARSVEGAKDAADLARRLEAIFRPVAPTVRVFPTGKRPQAAEHPLPSAGAQTLKVTRWVHHGFGTGNPQSIYRSGRVKEAAPNGKVPANFPDPRDPFYADLGRGVSCLVPIALFADERGTLPRAQSPEAAPKAAAPKAEASSPLNISDNDRATRLASVALGWNIFQHFYPYFDVVKTDWNRALRDALSAAATDPDGGAFRHTLERMVAELRDGHGNVYGRETGAFYFAPVLIGRIENRLVIIHVAPGVQPDLKPGDVIVKVGGKPAAELMAERARLISGATPQWIDYRLAMKIMAGDKDSELSIEVQKPSGERRAVKLRRALYYEKASEEDFFSESGLPKIHEVRDGILYVNLDRVKDDEFEKALPRLEAAKGIIFDLRGYPKVRPFVIGHLIDETVTSPQWKIPVVTMPDQKQMTFQPASWPVMPKAPRLKAKVAFLTDGRAISYAETFLGIIEHYKIAEIVGGPTAGTNGNINPFLLPGGYGISWTGMKVLKQDGSQHHGVGIKPTVAVSRTIRGVTEGRDEVLERAIEVVSK